MELGGCNRKQNFFQFYDCSLISVDVILRVKLTNEYSERVSACICNDTYPVRTTSVPSRYFLYWRFPWNNRIVRKLSHGPLGKILLNVYLSSVKTKLVQTLSPWKLPVAVGSASILAPFTSAELTPKFAQGSVKTLKLVIWSHIYAFEFSNEAIFDPNDSYLKLHSIPNFRHCVRRIN